jgi:hypothetical protein
MDMITPVQGDAAAEHAGVAEARGALGAEGADARGAEAPEGQEEEEGEEEEGQEEGLTAQRRTSPRRTGKDGSESFGRQTEGDVPDLFCPPARLGERRGRSASQRLPVTPVMPRATAK